MMRFLKESIDLLWNCGMIFVSNKNKPPPVVPSPLPTVCLPGMDTRTALTARTRIESTSVCSGDLLPTTRMSIPGSALTPTNSCTDDPKMSL